MSERANHFKVGIFVIIGFGLFVGALFALGFKNSFGLKDEFETYVDGGVENLAVGAVVKWRGVEIGKVSSIKFVSEEYPESADFPDYQQRVRIFFKVPQGKGIIDKTKSFEQNQQRLDTEIARGLRARVQSQGFIGPSILSLEYVDPKFYPFVPPPWTRKHYYFIPSAHSQFEHVFAALETTLSHTETLDLPALMARAQNAVDEADRLLTNINQIDFNPSGTNANSLIAEVRTTLLGLRDTLARAKDAIGDARHTLAVATNAIIGADLRTLSRKTQDTEDHVSSSVIELRRVLANVDTGELNGSLANIRAATEELNLLLQKWEQSSSSGLPLDLFSKPPKPATSVEEPPRK